MGYQEFDEKLQRLHQTTAVREEKLRARWDRISRRGLLIFVLTRGTLLFVWICLCFVAFSFLFHNQQLLHQRFLWETTLPCMALLGYIAPTMQYFFIRNMIRAIAVDKAR